MLNLDQKRSLGVILGIVEDELRRLVWMLDQPAEDWLFSSFTDDLKSGQKPLIAEKVRRLLEELDSLKRGLDLHYSTREFMLSSLVKSVAVSLAVHLESAKSKKLQGYGEINPGVKDLLDFKLDGIIHLLDGLGWEAGRPFPLDPGATNE